jgi:hypothetical protein
MNEITEVPAEIATIIESKRQALLKERQEKAESEKREREEAEAVGKVKYDEYIQAALTKVPEFLHQYLSGTDDQPDYYRIGKGWETPRDWLHFEIPGLAQIMFAPNAKQSPWKYQTASPYDSHYSYDGETTYSEPSLSFSDSQYGWMDDLDYALAGAEAELKKYQKYLEEWTVKQAEIAKASDLRRHEAELRERRDAEAAAQREVETAREKMEEQALFDVIKNDPVVMHLVKAFILVMDERRDFNAQLEGANESAYFMEERYSNRLAELRQQNEAAERNAQYEKDRLQSDLDDAESKLKKAERGW